MKKIICIALSLVMLLGVPITAIASGGSSATYTYTYNIWGVPTPSPDAYRVSAFILGDDFDIGHFRNPRDLFIIDNLIYVVDTGNSRVVVLVANDDGSHELVGVHYHATLDGAESTFNRPMGIFVSNWGEIWLADTYNQRILHMDENWNVINEILQPEASLLEGHMDFLPEKLAVDFTRRLFVQTRHVNRGLMEFDRYGEFAVYMGAAPVHVSMWNQIWRRIQTQEQRERVAPFIPTEYNNVNIDHEGFLFVTNTNENVDSVRRLNVMGADVLIRNGLFDIEGEVWWGNIPGISGPSQLIDIAPLTNDTFIAFDYTRGRLFAYDFQGNLLFVFGGVGNREGFFIEPTALDSMGFTLFALDAWTGAITRFDLTEYGWAINRALYLYRRGLYEESAEYWEDVLRMNGNFGLAYVGIARSLLRQGYYLEAMRLFELEHDRIGYGRAFGFFRRQWMEEYFWIFAVALGVVMIVPPVVKKILKVRREIRES